MTQRVLFVCLGNICRSPLGEGVFQHLVDVAGLSQSYEVESAGTSAYHAGERPDERSIEVARRHGVELPSCSRKLAASDYSVFDVLVAMDEENQRNMLRDCPEPLRHKVRMMREWDPEGPGDVPDPYYGGDRGFDLVYEMISRSCRALLDDLES